MVKVSWVKARYGHTRFGEARRVEVWQARLGMLGRCRARLGAVRQVWIDNR